MIEIKQLSKKFDDKKIFENFSLTIESNKSIAIIGKSGSGKSTLLNILGLLDTDYHGDVIINDIKINKLAFNPS